jgi:hypothetical protein
MFIVRAVMAILICWTALAEEVAPAEVKRKRQDAQKQFDAVYARFLKSKEFTEVWALGDSVRDYKIAAGTKPEYDDADNALWKTAEPIFTKLSKDPQPKVRSAVVKALSDIFPEDWTMEAHQALPIPASVATIVDAGLKDDSYVRMSALITIHHFGLRGKSLLPSVQKMLESEKNTEIAERAKELIERNLRKGE